MSTDTDGAPPSVSPGPQDGPGPPSLAEVDTEADSASGAAGLPSGSSWLQEEMRRRMAANRSSGGGRHARREGVDRPGVEHYLDRGPGPAPSPAASGAPTPASRPLLTSWVPDPYSPSGLRPPPAAGPVDESSRRLRLAAPGSRPAPPDAARPAPGAGAAPPDGSLPASDGRSPAPNPSGLRANAPVTPASPLPAVAPAPTSVEVTTPHVNGLFTSSVPTPRPAPLSSGPGFPPPTAVPPTAVPPTAGSSPADEVTADPDSGDAPTPESDVAAKRVRVVLSERKGVARSVRTVVDVQELTPVGELRTNLIGTQLAVALRVAAVAGLTLGLLPALFALVPAIGRIEVLGLRLPWLLLGVLVYPFLLGLGWWHTRSAEKVEQNFADHVQD
ncbi:hypothetical protein ACVGVM_00360 [Pseudonocardia bannensis]|uniref:hypothetical protein n=1 Tax=Pseudonocardia bannensis TaxID=630973 RepID=UPI001B7D0ED7|nr:hypothetical protein [Pseudonocardia bannensis]